MSIKWTRKDAMQCLVELRSPYASRQGSLEQLKEAARQGRQGQGLGEGGPGRGGTPKTQAEREQTHLRKFGSMVTPPRGTGIRR